MKFSSRLPHALDANSFSELLHRKKQDSVRVLDLTESNPTHAGIVYPPGLTRALDNDAALRYEPEPFGLLSARENIAEAYGAAADRVILTASTSEAYSWLFKLLCDPGDEILAPRPSYPLFEYLAALESVRVRHYSLFYDHGWYIDFETLRRSLNDRTRAIVLVNPNNPTGHFLKAHELEPLTRFGLPIISDEVFREYPVDPPGDALFSLLGVPDAAVFTLNGLSKSAGLPQMKLAWIIASGPVDEAMRRLEMIADTYLSAGTPVQLALPKLLELRKPVQEQIIARCKANLRHLQSSGLHVLKVEAGWHAVVAKDESDAVALLRDHDVLVQPGYFYDFERSGHIVLSLLTPSEIFIEGLRRLQL
jgi:alanine-synthesizing transaminase